MAFGSIFGNPWAVHSDRERRAIRGGTRDRMRVRPGLECGLLADRHPDAVAERCAAGRSYLSGPLNSRSAALVPSSSSVKTAPILKPSAPQNDE